MGLADELMKRNLGGSQQQVGPQLPNIPGVGYQGDLGQIGRQKTPPPGYHYGFDWTSNMLFPDDPNNPNTPPMTDKNEGWMGVGDAGDPGFKPPMTPFLDAFKPGFQPQPQPSGPPISIAPPDWQSRMPTSPVPRGVDLSDKSTWGKYDPGPMGGYRDWVSGGTPGLGSELPPNIDELMKQIMSRSSEGPGGFDGRGEQPRELGRLPDLGGQPQYQPPASGGEAINNWAPPSGNIQNPNFDFKSTPTTSDQSSADQKKNPYGQLGGLTGGVNNAIKW